MSYSISLKIHPDTHQRFKDLHSRFNAGEQESLAKLLGENLADIACEIIDQIFGRVVHSLAPQIRNLKSHSTDFRNDSQIYAVVGFW